jgi:hypothetical protein
MEEVEPGVAGGEEVVLGQGKVPAGALAEHVLPEVAHHRVVRDREVPVDVDVGELGTRVPVDDVEHDRHPEPVALRDESTQARAVAEPVVDPELRRRQVPPVDLGRHVVHRHQLHAVDTQVREVGQSVGDRREVAPVLGEIDLAVDEILRERRPPRLLVRAPVELRLADHDRGELPDAEVARERVDHPVQHVRPAAHDKSVDVPAVTSPRGSGARRGSVESDVAAPRVAVALIDGMVQRNLQRWDVLEELVAFVDDAHGDGEAGVGGHAGQEHPELQSTCHDPSAELVQR